MSNTFTGSYLDGSPLTKALLDTAYQTLQLDIANTALTTTGSTTGQALLSNGSGIAASFQSIPDPQGPFSLRNYGLQATVASSVLTISLKSKAGTNPTATDAVNFNYSTNGTTTATYNTVNVTAATSISVNASATLGGYSGTGAQRVYVYGYYNTATTSVKLAVSKSSVFDTGARITMTAITASADNGSILYATAALTVAPRLLGFVESSFSSFGGDWQTPTRVSITQNRPYPQLVASTSAASVGNIFYSGDCGSFQTSSSTYVGVTNLSGPITTKGGPVSVEIIASGLSSPSLFRVFNTGDIGAAATLNGFFNLFRGTVSIGVFEIGQVGTRTTGLTIDIPTTSIRTLDVAVVGVPGTYTYSGKLLLSTTGTGGLVRFSNSRLMLREL